MQLIIKNRANGKTTDLIIMSAFKKIPIVCAHPEYIVRKAKEMKLKIPPPISFYEIDRNRAALHGIHEVLIDEMDWFLQAVFGIKCNCATIDIGIDILNECKTEGTIVNDKEGTE